MNSRFNPAVDSSKAIVWRTETVFGPIIRRKESEYQPAYRAEPFIYY